MKRLLSTLLAWGLAHASTHASPIFGSCRGGSCSTRSSSSGLRSASGPGINPLTGRPSEFAQVKERASLAARIQAEKDAIGFSHTERMLQRRR